MDELVSSISLLTWVVLEIIIIGFSWGNLALSNNKSWALLIEDLFLGVLIGNSVLLASLSYFGPEIEFWILILLTSLTALNAPIIGRTIQSLFVDRLEPVIKNLLNRVMPKINGKGKKH